MLLSNVILIQSSSGQSFLVRAVLDSGSESSFIFSKLAQHFGRAEVANTTSVVNFGLTSRTKPSFLTEVEALAENEKKILKSSTFFTSDDVKAALAIDGTTRYFTLWCTMGCRCQFSQNLSSTNI